MPRHVKPATKKPAVRAAKRRGSFALKAAPMAKRRVASRVKARGRY